MFDNFVIWNIPRNIGGVRQLSWRCDPEYHDIPTVLNGFTCIFHVYSAVSAVHISDMLSELLLAAWIVRFSRVNRLSAENLRETEHFFTLNRSFFAPPLVRGRFEASITAYSSISGKISVYANWLYPTCYDRPHPRTSKRTGHEHKRSGRAGEEESIPGSLRVCPRSEDPKKGGGLLP